MRKIIIKKTENPETPILGTSGLISKLWADYFLHRENN